MLLEPLTAKREHPRRPQAEAEQVVAEGGALQFDIHFAAVVFDA
jgi:hypothetical protein